MPKYDLSNQYVSEYLKYNSLFALGNSRSTTGGTWTSPSSGLVYTYTNETNLMSQLKTFLNDYMISAVDWNEKSLDVLTTEGDIAYQGSTKAQRLPKGTARQGLIMNPSTTAPQWADSLQSLMTQTGDIVYASSPNTPAKLSIGNRNSIMYVKNGIPAWGFDVNGIGRTFADFGFKNTTFTNCGFNGSGEVTLDDYKLYSQTAYNTTQNSSLQIYPGVGIGQKFDETFTQYMTKINYLSAYVYKYDNAGYLGNLIGTLYDETTSTILSTIIITKANITSDAWVNFNFNCSITKGHIIQFRVHQSGSYSSTTCPNDYYLIYFSTTSTVNNSYKISTTNTANYDSPYNWGTVTSDTVQDTHFRINYDTNPLQTTGTIVKTITPSKVDVWRTAQWIQTLPTNSSITCDVLDNSNNVLKSNITNPRDLSDINVASYPTLKLRWTLTRTNTGISTPKISNPSLTWQGEISTTKKSQTYSTAGTFTFTAPITGWYKVTVVGGGGGGGYLYNTSAYQGQGGGGGTAIGLVTLVAGTSYSVIVGTGGIKGYDVNPHNTSTGTGNTGGTGGTSSFQGISATGGYGGQGVSYYGYGGSGGSGSGGYLNLSGMSGISSLTGSADYSGNGTSHYNPYGKGGWVNSAGNPGIVILEWEE